MLLLRFRVLGMAVLLGPLAVSCIRKTVSFNSKNEMPLLALAQPGDSLTTTARRGAPKLSTAARKAILSKEEERAAKEQEHATQRKKTKTKKNVFLGERVKKAFVRTGQGKTAVIEVFYYLKTFKQPSELAPAVYYYNPRKHKIFKASGELDPANDKVLHGTYKKLQNNKVLETGYYANGTRHLRWERFDTKGGLTAKTHYELGFPRDANISYYDAGQTMIREVVPYVNGKLDGDYVKYTPEGKREWTGHFENGHRVGEWTNYWDYKNYRHYVFQYADSGYDPEPEEPELVREYSHGGSVIYDKEKNLDKRGDADPDAAAKSDPRRPGSHGTYQSRPPLRKPQDRRPGYHPKPPVTPPPVPATPNGTATPAGTTPAP